MKRNNIPLNFKEKNNSKISLYCSVAVLLLLFFCFHQLDYSLITKPETEAKESEQKEYAWLSPEGDIHSAEWGCHEMAAQWLCRELGIDSGYRICRDILVERGWCLIDDPYDSGRYFVTHKKDLTKKQKDFLYGYFLDMGMKKRAEEFVRDNA